MNRINWGSRAAMILLAGLLGTGMAGAQSAPNRQSNNAPSPTTNVNVVNTPTVNVASMPAVALGPSQVTNIGQRPSQQVVLSNNSNNLGCTSWFRVGPDGTPSTFSIPSGQYLVVTDMEFVAFNTPSTPGTYELLGLSLGPYNETVLGSYVVVDSTGAVATQQHLTTGIVMSLLPNCSTGTGPNTIEQVVLRGYLIPAS
jgi:hypothetical protein